MILADAYSNHPAIPNAGSYEFYSYLDSLYVMFSDGIPRKLNNQTSLSVVTKTSSFTVTTEQIILTTGVGLIIATLPSAIGYLGTIVFKHTGTQDLTILPVLSQTIDGLSDVQLRANRKNSATLFSDGANWWVI